MSDFEAKKATVRNLCEQGKKHGVLARIDVSKALEEFEITPEEIETIYDILEKEGICGISTRTIQRDIELMRSIDGILKIGGADFDALGAMFAKLEKLTGNDTVQRS